MGKHLDAQRHAETSAAQYHRPNTQSPGSAVFVLVLLHLQRINVCHTQLHSIVLTQTAAKQSGPFHDDLFGGGRWGDKSEVM